MHPFGRHKSLSLFLVLAFLFYGFCALIPVSHACCKGLKPNDASVALKTTRPSEDQPPIEPCCIKSLYDPHQDTQPISLPDQPLVWLPDTFSRPLEALLQLEPGPSTFAMAAQQYVPDQSGRHLELGVLLN